VQTVRRVQTLRSLPAKEPCAMEGFVALILAGTIFRTQGTWAVTRAISILDCVVAIFYSYTPLHPYLGRVWLGMLLVTLVVWVFNLTQLPRSAKDG
jgi:hypothetical protein